jgi:hypothetical protein
MSERERRNFAIAAAGCFIAITQLLSRDKLECLHLISLGCFFSALPFLAVTAATNRLDDLKPGTFLSLLFAYFRSFSLFVFWLGLVALAFSFRWFCGVFFMSSSLVVWAGLHITRHGTFKSN